MEPLIVPVILSGGDGTRLWPLSRQNIPKQFIKISSQLSLFQKTVKRLTHISCEQPLILTNEKHQKLVEEQLKEINVFSTIILEPAKKDTAAAITLASIYIREKYQSIIKNVKMLVLASDHYIKDDSIFGELVNELAQSNYKGLISIAVKPSSPHTGYGYIQVGNSLSPLLHKIQKFHEKPSLDKAMEYIESNFYWNCGIFLFDLEIFTDEIIKNKKGIYDCCRKSLENGVISDNTVRVSKEIFEQCESISIDYAVMEKTSYGALALLDTLWSDIGAWDSLAEFESHDEHNNVVLGDLIHLFQTKNSLVYSSSNKNIFALGIDNIFVIDTNDSLLIVDKLHLQKIKDVVSSLDKIGLSYIK